VRCATFVRAIDYIDEATAYPFQALAILETDAMALFGLTN
jgi:hypothetical protein